MNKRLTDIDGAVNRAVEAFKPSGPRVRNVDNTFGIYRRKDGQLQMGSKVVKTSEDGTILSLDDSEYDLTPGLHALITQKIPRPIQYNADDYQRSLVKQTKVKLSPNRIKGGIKPRGNGKKYSKKYLARFATKVMMTTAAKTAMRGTLNAAKRAIPHLIAHKVASTIADAAKKQKRVDIDAKQSLS